MSLEQELRFTGNRAATPEAAPSEEGQCSKPSRQVHRHFLMVTSRTWPRIEYRKQGSGSPLPGTNLWVSIKQGASRRENPGRGHQHPPDLGLSDLRHLQRLNSQSRLLVQRGGQCQGQRDFRVVHQNVHTALPVDCRLEQPGSFARPGQVDVERPHPVRPEDLQQRVVFPTAAPVTNTTWPPSVASVDGQAHPPGVVPER